MAIHHYTVPVEAIVIAEVHVLNLQGLLSLQQLVKAQL